MKLFGVLSFCFLLGVLNGCPTKETRPEPTPPFDIREPCSNSNPLRTAYFGDLHVHTGFSFDAYVHKIRTKPTDAYEFAKGNQILLPPLDSNGVGTTPIHLQRPLDFTAVTDHAEYFGETQVCIDPTAEGYDSQICQKFRQENSQSTLTFGIRLANEAPSRFGFCDSPEDVDCARHAQSVWKAIQDAAEVAYDRSSACTFTSFVGYEYSGTPGVSNLHRNVIFKNATVPEKPVSYLDEPNRVDFWKELKRTCIDENKPCDVLAIPHNSNLSNGKLFALEFPEDATLDEQKAIHLLRREMEPLVEIYQHKNDSECMNGLGAAFGVTDEACSFEKYRFTEEEEFEDCGEGTGNYAMNGGGCTSKYDFVRNALIRGLKEKNRLGINPLKLGISASTDTHSGTPGAVSEKTWKGHIGGTDGPVTNRIDGPTLPPGAWKFSPGGLTGLWAEENSRDSLFEAMRRKEAWGTSGPRITVRLFGGWSYPPEMCSDPNLVEKGYAGGVPMGGDFPPASSDNASPTFVVLANQDAGVETEPGTPLAKIQIIKGSVSADGTPKVEVFDIAQDTGDYSIDPSSCTASGSGAASLCQQWTDPNFDPTDHAYYYVRVLEYPSCRWSTYLCNEFTDSPQPENCVNPLMPKLIEERAWTSPIWFTPQ
ncbi:MAG TPA: DUF3604 domain-containing protein [Rhodospirillales bacterium]|nr:DUF3604 domain-containing protein [Rhodospirillales bacterium]